MLHVVRWMLVIGTILVTSSFLTVQAAGDDEMVDNPMYKYWSNFKKKSTVTLSEKTVFGQADKSEVPEGIEEKVVTYTLTSVSPESAVVRIVVTEREFLGFLETAPTKKTFPAKVKKSLIKATITELGGKVGEEELEVDGKKLACKTLTGSFKKDDTMVEHKSWYSDTVPGGLVKRTRTTKQDGKLVADTTITLKSFKSEE
jgi:hypothetical protein